MSHENNGSALAAAIAAPAIMPVLKSDITVLAVCVYSFFIRAGINAWIVPMLAPPSNAAPIRLSGEALKPRNKQATSRMKSPSIMPRTAPTRAKSQGPHRAASPIIATGRVVNRLNCVAVSPASRCSSENSGPTEARMGRRFSPTIKAITAKSKGDVRFNMESFSVVNGPGKLLRAFILTLR
ncbi:hypothetical protein DI57_08430 [Enterobacter asburiae L1]|nr:hypothetical protein DI57_08430 [Enterobacter asburiae L1]